MARTIAEIKNEMTARWMSESAVQEKYGLTGAEAFEEVFPKVSVESLLFYVVSVGVWVLEKLMDDHRADVEQMLGDKVPHTTRWYRNLVLRFCPDWADEAPVKYCSVDDRGCRLKVKIAGGDAGAREPVSEAVCTALASYLAEEKDAGLKIEIVNENRNALKVGATIYYDPTALLESERRVEQVLKEYVSTLEFDGLLTRGGVEGVMASVSGVRLVKLTQLETKYCDQEWEAFGEQRRAESGYWTLIDENVTIAYERYRKEDIA